MSKLNKKSFSEGMDSMFGETLDIENAKEKLSHYTKSAEKNEDAKSAKSSTKRFTSQLESFLASSIEDSLFEQLANAELASGSTDAKNETNTEKGAKRSSKKPAIGLDLLIRSTLEGSEMYENEKKRITFTFEKDKIDKLKMIAESEKAKIRDIIEQLVSTYINQKATVLNK